MSHHKYQVIQIIGEGAYGIVYKCKNNETNEIVAIKKFIEEYEKLPKLVFNRELFLLQISNHENIVKFKEAFINKGFLFLVFDYVEKNLLQFIEENQNGLNQELIRSFTYQMCKAVSYLHKRNIIHRDIKPENILIKDCSKVELCDFGFARKMKINGKTNSLEKMTEYIATRWYRAPELILGQGNYGPEVDFWSIGCLMGEMANGNALFPGDNQINQLEYIIKLLGNLPENLVKCYNNNPNFNTNELLKVDKPETLEKRFGQILDSDAIDFMKCLLELDPKKRLNANTVFNHKYFQCFKNMKNFERNKNNDLNNNKFLSLSIDDKKGIKIPNYNFDNFDNKEKESKIINIFRYDDESFISETNESTLSKKKNLNHNKKNNLMKSFQNKKRKHYRSDMVDFGDLYILSEKGKNEEVIKSDDNKQIKEENKSNDDNQIEDQENNKCLDNKQIKDPNNIINSKIPLNQILDYKGLNQKKSFSLIKQNNNINSSIRSITEENYPYFSSNLLLQNKSSEKNIKNNKKRINYFSLFNSLKLENFKKPYLNHITQKSKKIILLPIYKSETKNNKKYNKSMEPKNRILKNIYYKPFKRKSFDNFINGSQEETSSKRIVNLYENTFKDIVLNSQKKERLPYSPIKRKIIIKGIFKNSAKKNANNNNFKKNHFQLPPISNFHNDKNGQNIFKYDFKNINNRYKIANI